MTEVIMPKMGDGMEEGTLLEWLKADGDKVKSGEVIGTIQTDKATLELEAPGSGTLKGIKLEAGGTVPVGQAIAAILKEGESLPADWGAGVSVTPAASEGSVDAPQKPAGTPFPVPADAPTELQQAATTPTRPEAASGEFGITADQATATNSQGTEESAQAAKHASSATDAQPVTEGRVKASPLARKVAAEKGIDLAQVKGTGPGGRIVEADVSGFKPPVAPPAPTAVAAPGGEDEIVKLPRLRIITGKRTQESKQQVPHFYVTVEVDVENILGLRAMFEAQEAGKVTINDFVMKACALALREMPEINASLQGTDSLKMHGSVNVGIAVALADGLTVPVVKNADKLSLRELSATAKELAKKARDGKASMDDLSGSTFAVSNMGMLDVDNFIAIVNQPNAAIVAIASVRKKAVVDEETGEIVARSRMNVTGSFDHRVCDGAGGAKFVNLVKTYLENPTRLLS